MQKNVQKCETFTFTAVTAAAQGSSHDHADAVSNLLFAAVVLRRDSWDGGLTVLWERNVWLHFCGLTGGGSMKRV